MLTHTKKDIKLFDGWTFWDYVSPSGNNMIEAWIKNDLLLDGQLMFSKMVKNIARIENHLQWTPFRKFIKSKKSKVWELGFFADGRQYRVLGDFYGEKEAVFLIGCYHKQKRYYPADAIEQAFKRKGELKNGSAKHEERKIPVN